MKILFVLDYYVPHVGWAETLFRNVIERLAKKGHQIKVLTCRHNADVPVHEAMGANIEVYRVGSGRFDLMWHALGKTGRTLAQEADVIHTTTYSAAVPASILWVLFQKRTVITVHEVFWRLWYRFMGWKGFFHKAFERAVFLLPFDAYLCVSNYTKNSLRLLFWLPDDKLSTVYNGIDTEFWDASKTDVGLASRIRAELGLEKAFSTLYFGRPGVSKGLEHFLEAIPRVCQKIPHFKAVCIVSGDDAERVAVMKRKIAELGIADRVIWKGAVPYGELREYLMAADSVIVPSLVEGFWFSAAEASALWRPLVYSNAAALPEVVFGTTVPAEPGNSADIARAIVDLSEGKTVQVARKVFDWEENVEKTEKMYANGVRAWK